MILLFLALAIFLALHSVPAIPALRTGAIMVMGRRTYLAVYSLVSLLSLGFVFHAGLNTPYVELWAPAGWQAAITLVAAPIGLFLVLAGLISPNPLSITLRSGPVPGAITRLTRHPVLWGFTLWAFGHLAINGDLRSLVLFGGLGLFSLAGFPMLDRRAKKRFGPVWPAMTDTAPLLARTTTGLGFDRPMWIAMALTIATTIALLAGGHAALFGADPLTALAY